MSETTATNGPEGADYQKACRLAGVKPRPQVVHCVVCLLPITETGTALAFTSDPPTPCHIGCYHDYYQRVEAQKAAPTEAILTEAARLIDGQRNTDYGKVGENFDRIASIWGAILGQPVTKEQVILCMIGLKSSRLANSPGHRDSWVDIAGYVGLIDKMRAGE